MKENMIKYSVTDGNGDTEIEAESAQAACQEWVDEGDWGSVAKTTWVACRATPLDDADEPLHDEFESHTIEIPPTGAGLLRRLA